MTLLLSATLTVTANVTIEQLGTYVSGAPLFAQGAEIVDYDSCLQRMYVTNSFTNNIDVVDLSGGDASGISTLVTSLEHGFTDHTITSVTVMSETGLVAATLKQLSPNVHEPGLVVFYEYEKDGDEVVYEMVGTVTVGVGPDMLTVTPDGMYILVANEGQPDEDLDATSADFVDPDGSISVIDISDGAQAVIDDPDTYVTSLTFDYLVGTEDALRAFGVRIAPGKTAPEDFEPEYITVSPDSTTAFVSLQENNSVAKIDLVNMEIVDILPLGFQDHTFIALDPSNEDGAATFRTLDNLLGMRMPDGMAAFEAADGELYFATANEGDARDYGDVPDEFRIADIVDRLDPAVFPDTTDLADDAIFGRLHVSVYEDQTNVETLFSYGSRSFTIFDENGKLVFDSGMDFEFETLRAFPTEFNANTAFSTFDDRSDDKGPEPESIDVGMVGDRIYAFIGLERMGGVMIYDITVPAESFFVDYVNNRDFSVSSDVVFEDASASGDLGPEGIKFVPPEDSPIPGTPLLLVANESSGTTTVYEVTSGDMAATETGKGKGKKKKKKTANEAGKGSNLVRQRRLNGNGGSKGKGKGSSKQCPF